MSLIMEILNTHSLVDNHGLFDGMIEIIKKNRFSNGCKKSDEKATEKWKSFLSR